ncbi:hypothetical protein Vretimale_1259 [Volvox reticuliferus]|uniref:Uncharacterized protein n=1 Tax=Volvox reticuliferus TaxID=1737510 RepID=A0A8J4FMT1_9CHLO|nr:hypothetical protein Vretifemale_10611 [Volvox reticuliferus]GIL95169.1 hypothetical protein Vretimale_1259 [Volvox reticuliferus]
MVGPASLHRLPKSLVTCDQGKRVYRINAMAVDPNVQAAVVSRHQDSRRVDTRYLLTCISAIATQLISANSAWSEIPRDGLFSVQAAQPLTELSSDSSIELPSAPELLTTTDTAEVAPETATVASTDASEAAASPASVLVAEVQASEESAPELLAVAATESQPNPVPGAVVAAEEVPAEPAVASPIVAMNIPAMPAVNADTDLKTLVAALIRNEQFIAALVNNEAFLDRLAGEDRVVEELARRKGMSAEVEARDELATELRRRQQMMDELAARGEAAVLAVADAAKQAAEQAAAAARSETLAADSTGEVGVVSSGQSALVAMETAVELLEDSQELLAAVEANPGNTPLSALMNDDKRLEQEFKTMEAAVARAEKSVSKTLEKNGAEPLPAVQEAVRELYAGEQKQQDDVTINRAYTDLVTAVAEMQRAYGSAISKAVGHAVAEVVEVEEAALKGAEKTKVLMSQKVGWFGW